jgi:hypothetical protein
MSHASNVDGSEDVNDFLQRIRELGDKRDKEDEERTRKLEEEILQGRKERQARRAGKNYTSSELFLLRKNVHLHLQHLSQQKGTHKLTPTRIRTREVDFANEGNIQRGHTDHKTIGSRYRKETRRHRSSN